MTTCPPQCQKPIRKDTAFRERIGVRQMPLNTAKSSKLTGRLSDLLPINPS
ncbi:hypothetical protein [Roseibium alexandrii]|uniref:hypothetical protein n=1 Tax=Roseibium alexandrii TaxID=388408 RepID=UPI003750A4CB